MFKKTSGLKLVALMGGMAIAQVSMANPINFSFSGNFSLDDDVQFFNFTADGASTAYLLSYGYAGGTQADGTVNFAGGMDTILTLFDSSGAIVGQNDDGPSDCFSAAEGLVAGIVAGNTDPNTGQIFDTCFSSALAAGDYTVAVSQYNNFATGPNLANGFIQDGAGNFTGSYGCANGSFCDVSSANRTNFWAFDILNVSSADEVEVPVPATLALFGLGLAGLGWSRRKKA